MRSFSPFLGLEEYAGGCSADAWTPCSHSVRVSPQLANRLVAAARSVLNRYIPDIYIYTDVYRGEDSGKCVPGSLSFSRTSSQC